MKDLILFRGIPGSGKSSLAVMLCENNVAADMYWDRYHNGEFIGAKIKQAHQWCKDQCEVMLKAGERKVAVHNTFTTEKEMQPYIDLAEQYGYRVHTVIVENRHGNVSVHNVPEASLTKMRDRFVTKI